jgi:nitronate monooxygenase
MPRATAFTALLGIEHPVVQAPMAGFSTPALAAAVSEAGGLGSLGAAALGPDELLQQAGAVRELTDRPFNLNFFCHPAPTLDAAAAARERARLAPLYAELGLGEPPEPFVPPLGFDAARLEAVTRIRPAVVSFHFGLPDAAAVDGIAAAEHGSPDFLALWAGQAAPLAVELPAAELVARIAGEAERVLAELMA